MYYSRRNSFLVAAAFVMASNITAAVLLYPPPPIADLQTSLDDESKDFFPAYLERMKVTGIAIYHTPDITAADETINSVFIAAISITQTHPNYNETDFMTKEHKRHRFFVDEQNSWKIERKYYLVFFCIEFIQDDPSDLGCMGRVVELQPWMVSFKSSEIFLLKESSSNYWIKVRHPGISLWYLEHFIHAISRSRVVGNIVRLNKEGKKNNRRFTFY